MKTILRILLILSFFNFAFVSPSVAETKPWNNEGLYELCSMGMPAACHNYAISVARGDGVELNNKKAATYYILACKMDYGPSCNNIGVQYYYGIGQKQNVKTAKSYFEKACTLDDTVGCKNIEEANKEADVNIEGRDCNKDEYWTCGIYPKPKK